MDHPPSYDELLSSVTDEAVADSLGVLAPIYDSAAELDELRRIYADKGIALVLGAGVSASCGAPPWTELLLRLHQHQLQGKLKHDLSQLTRVYSQAIAEDGPLIQARLAIGEKSDDDAALMAIIRAKLYPKGAGKSALVKALARLAVHAEGRRGVNAILTYNYDLLLEEEFDAIGRPYRRLDRKDQAAGIGIPIRHVHGYLGRAPIPDEWIVLNESAYHAEYANPFSWSNVVQVNTFRESSCLFVGLSMTDPNLRRLLEGARVTATPTHYACPRKTGLEAFDEYLDGLAGDPSAGQRARIEDRLRLVGMLADSNRGAALEGLGVTVVWFDDFDGLPGLIDRVRLSP